MREFHGLFSVKMERETSILVFYYLKFSGLNTNLKKHQTYVQLMRDLSSLTHQVHEWAL